MSLQPRAVLSLRGAAAPAPAPPPKKMWVCKPCGGRVEHPEGLVPEDSVRCPSCNARLGKVADFDNPTPTFARLRARPAPPPAPPAPVVPKVLVSRSATKKVWTKS